MYQLIVKKLLTLNRVLQTIGARAIHPVHQTRNIPGKSTKIIIKSGCKRKPIKHFPLQTSDDSYTVEWESYVTESGSLFYLEYNIQPIQPAHNSQLNSDKNQGLLALRGDFKRSSTRRSKKAGIRLSNLINGNHKSHKDAMKKKMLMSSNKSNAVNRNDATSVEKDTGNKVKFNELAEGELKEITVFIDPSMRHKFGRRTSVAEALLGVSVCPFPDSARIMIAGYMPNSEISQDKAIKIGDWLKAVNNQDINVENFELILLSFTQPTYIKLQLKRIAVEEPPQNHPNIGKATSTGEFVGTLKSLFPTVRHDEHDNKTIFSVLYLSLKEDDERCMNGEDVIFSYPPKEYNCKKSYFILPCVLSKKILNPLRFVWDSRNIFDIEFIVSGMHVQQQTKSYKCLDPEYRIFCCILQLQ